MNRFAEAGTPDQRLIALHIRGSHAFSLTERRLLGSPGGSTVLRSFMYDTNTLSSTFSGNYTQGRLVAVQNAQFQPGQSTSPSEIEFTEMYAYTQPGEMSARRLQVNETVPEPGPLPATWTLRTHSIMKVR